MHRAIVYVEFSIASAIAMCETSYGQRNTTHFGITAYCNYCRVSKNRQKRSRQGVVRVLGGIFVGCLLLLSEERRQKGHERH